MRENGALMRAKVTHNEEESHNEEENQT